MEEQIAISRCPKYCCVFVLNGAAVSWKSKLQSVVALSTAEAESMALCETVKEAVHLQQMLEEIG